MYRKSALIGLEGTEALIEGIKGMTVLTNFALANFRQHPTGESWKLLDDGLEDGQMMVDELERRYRLFYDTNHPRWQ